MELNVVYIENKPVMNCVLAVVTGLSNPNTQEITLKARGRAISTSIDAAEIAKRKIVKGLEVSKIATGTEEIQEEGGKRAVSTIEITLTRQKPPTS